MFGFTGLDSLHSRPNTWHSWKEWCWSQCHTSLGSLQHPWGTRWWPLWPDCHVHSPSRTRSGSFAAAPRVALCHRLIPLLYVFYCHTKVLSSMNSMKDLYFNQCCLFGVGTALMTLIWYLCVQVMVRKVEASQYSLSTQVQILWQWFTWRCCHGTSVSSYTHRTLTINSSLVSHHETYTMLLLLSSIIFDL